LSASSGRAFFSAMVCAVLFADALFKGIAVFSAEHAEQLTDRGAGENLEVFLASTDDISHYR
jgi:hypothetical protein